MRILEVNKYLYLRRGAEKHLLDLVPLLQEAGHEVRLFGMEHPENILLAQQENLPTFVGYHEHDSSFWQRVKGIVRIFWSFEVARKFRVLLKEWQPDIIHIHNIYHQLSFSLLREARKQGIPIIMTVHDYASISPDKDEYHFSIGKRYWKFLFIKKYSLGKRFLLILRAYWEQSLGGYETFVDTFIVPSQVVARALIHAGLPAAKVVVLPHFFAGELIEDTFLSKEKFLLTLGGASILKGTPELENIALKLNTPLVICGPIEEGYTKNKSSLTEYRGVVPKEEVQRLIQQAQAVVSASQLPETFGLVALESLAYGTPFFCLDRGAYKEIVRSGIDGEVCATVQELEVSLRLYLEGKKSYERAEMIRSIREHFGKEKYKERLLALYKSLLH